MELQDNREALNAAAQAGDILLASGAEIFRVEETISRICQAYGVKSGEAFVLSSGIFITAGSDEEQEFARVRHIPLCAARLDRVAAVNQLSREIVAGKHTPSQARAQLDKIQHMPPKPRLHQVLASGAGSACFCFLFGGDWLDSLAALLAGLVLYLYLLYIVQGRLSKIASNISGGALVTLVGILLYQAGIGHHLGEMIIGSIIPLVPGVAFTTAIRDIADEDYIAGAVRMLDALLVTFCIAMGVGLVMMAWCCEYSYHLGVFRCCSGDYGLRPAFSCTQKILPFLRADRRLRVGML